MRPRPGTVISAGFQSAGSGQYGRAWFGSAGKNLYISVILRPEILPSQQSVLSNFAALAVRDTISELIRKNATIKWPNDIYVGSRKVAGILIQNSLSSSEVHTSVVGIGINVNEHDFPGALPNPSSLLIEGGQPHELKTVFQALLGNLNVWHERARTLPVQLLRKQYERVMYRHGQQAKFMLYEDESPLIATIKFLYSSTLPTVLESGAKPSTLLGD